MPVLKVILLVLRSSGLELQRSLPCNITRLGVKHAGNGVSLLHMEGMWGAPSLVPRSFALACLLPIPATLKMNGQTRCLLHVTVQRGQRVKY